MSNLLKTELYKLFHSWYFWGIGIFNLLLSSILLLDREYPKVCVNLQTDVR